MKKGLKFSITIAVILLVAYNSVYFKKLDEVKASATESKFDAVKYARNFYSKKLLPGLNKAVEINQLMALLQSDKNKAFSTYSNALGIGNIKYFLVKGQGEITAINENDVVVITKRDTAQKSVEIETEFVFGNAIRDASGLININEFENTMDFNNVSAEVNKIIRAEVVPPFKASAKKGNTVTFVGAIELNQAHLNLEKIEV